MPSLSLSLSLSSPRARSPRARLASAACVSPRVSPRVASSVKKNGAPEPLFFSSDNSAHITESTVVFPCSTPHRSAIKNTGTILDRSIEIFPPMRLDWGGERHGHTRAGTQWGGPRRRERERRRRREDLRRRDLCASAFTAAPRGPGETPRARALERERERRRGGERSPRG